MKTRMKFMVNSVLSRSVLLVLLTAMLPMLALADDNTNDVSDAESAAMALTKANAPVWQETDPTVSSDPTQTNTPYLANRRALVGYNCQLNRIVTSVGVGAWTNELTNMVDDDLNNNATFPAIVGASAVTNPIVGVRDLANYYAAGTTAGFCIVASGGTKVLSLNVIKTMHIWLYCDGKRVDDLTVREGNTGSGVKLQLFAVGTDSACVNLTAVSTKKFDELVLVQGAGLDADVGGVLKVKYAFVGEAHDIYMTTNGIRDYCTETGHPQMTVSCDAYMPSPLVGGIPLTVISSYRARAIDDDLTNTVPLVSAVQLASIAFKGRVRVNVENSDASVSELFHEGDQVGFKFNVVEVLNLVSIGAWIDIKLYDHNGNDVQTTTVSVDGLALSLASGGDQTSYIVAEKDFSGAEITFYTALGVLDVGSGFGVYYGFVRPKPTIEKHHCPINASYGVDICETQSTYQLLHNEDVSVTWTLVSKPSGSAATVTADGYVQNMDLPGDYTFRATAVDGCYEDVTLTHGIDAHEIQCEVPVKATDGYELSTSIYGSSGSLVSWSDHADKENIIDNDYENYATYTGGLSLGDNLMVVGVKTTDGSKIFEGNLVAQQPMRVGFVVEEETQYLDLNALNLYNIRCYNNGTEVYSHALTDVGVVNVGIAGTGESKKVRYVIEVPKVDSNGNPIIFDEFQLWKSGVLNIQASTTLIYYPFTEEISDANSASGCGNAIMEGSNVLSYYADHAYVSAENIGAVSVADVISNLSNIVDHDTNLDTYATIVKGVGSGQTVISVMMGHVQDYRQQVGIVVDNTQYVQVDLGSVFKISTYLNGEATGEEQSTWNAIGVNAVSSGDQTVLLLTPTKEYDEIRITITNGLTVAQTHKIYGVILRNDIDHDGISDFRDESSCTSTVDDMQPNKTCLNGTITLTGTAATGTTYWIEALDQATVTPGEGDNPDTYTYTGVPDADQDNATGRFKVTSTQETDNNLVFSFTAIKTGHMMRAYIYDGSGNRVGTAYYTVHPLQTTWKTEPNNKDWNNWNNWTEGSPYLCTDVIIPAGAEQYPSLDEAIATGEEDKYGCDRIYFESRAAVDKVFKLNYTQAWVDVNLQPDRYYLLSAPLQNMYTGDMFIGKEGTAAVSPAYFQNLTGDTYRQNRFAPRVFQRLWEKAADVKMANGDLSTGAADIQETRWSKRFNALKYDYKFGEGFSVWADPDGNDAESFTFRFPKEQTAYNYYNEVTRDQMSYEETELARTNAHRFFYEQGKTPVNYTYLSADDRQVYHTIGDVTVTATAAESTTTFLVGNPFMSHIDVQAFLEENTDVISEVKTYDGNTTASAIAVAGSLITTGDNFTTIMPMEAFYVTAKTAGTTLNVKFTEAMFKPAAGQASAGSKPALAMHRAPRAASTPLSALRITAMTDGLKATTMLLDGPHEVFAETLFDDEVQPRLAIFSMSDGRAYDISTVSETGIIPLGICLKEAADVTLHFNAAGGFDLSEYELFDVVTGISYSLDSPVTISLDGTAIGRYSLRSKSATGISAQEMGGSDSDVVISFDGQTAKVSSTQADITGIELFTLDGRTVASKKVSPSQSVALAVDMPVGLMRIHRSGRPDVVRKFVK